MFLLCRVPPTFLHCRKHAALKPKKTKESINLHYFGAKFWLHLLGVLKHLSFLPQKNRQFALIGAKY